MKRSWLVLVLAVSVLLTGFAGTGSLAATYNESPMLTERVEQGELPPVEERLPKVPFVVGPGVNAPEDHVDFEVGRYDGPFNMAHHVPDLDFDIYIMSSQNLLQGQGTSVVNLQPNLLESFEVSEDNSVFTFTIREGLRWSDGVPVTTEDVRFAVEDVMFNETLNPVVPVLYRTGGRPDGDVFEFNVIDEYTFSVSFSEPYGAFITETAVAGWWHSYNALLKPSHYLKQFHIDYTDIEQMQPYLEAEELDEDEWWQLFDIKDITGTAFTAARAIGFPTLTPWMRVEGPSGVMVFERNPYFHKVDTAGNQLPYMDEIRSYEVSDMQMVEMLSITGESDWLRDGSALPSMPLYTADQERGGYEVRVLENHLAPTILKLNPTYDDATWQSLVNNVEFRRALNMAIDREEIIDVVYFGMAEKPSLVPSEFDPDEANRILDSIGMDQRDSEGFRLAPDGSPFEIFIEYAEYAADFTPTLELLNEYFNAVGVHTSLRQISGSLVSQRIGSNEIMASMLWRSVPQWHGLVNTDYLPMRTWGNEWRSWYTSGGASGIEPPEDVKELYQLHETAMALVPSTPESDEAIDAIFQWFYDNIPYFVTVEAAGYPVLISERLRNVPTKGLAIDAAFIGEQYFFAE